MNVLTRHAYDQFRLPRGPLGHLAGRIMSRRESNLARSRWTVDLLDLAPGDRVLEVGFGPGIGLAAALAAVPDGEVVGIDHSDQMRRAAARRNAAAVAAGRLVLHVGDVERADLGDARFDAIFSCNVWMFWRSPVDTVRRLAALLVPGGVLAVTHMPRHSATADSDADRAGETLVEQFTAAGTTGVRRERTTVAGDPAVCVLGLR